jgi:hypothetical protein
MNTNQIFDWSRFEATVRKEWAENGRPLLLVAAGIYLLFTVILIGGNLSDRGMGSNSANFIIIFIAMALIASLGFTGLIDKSKRSDYLTEPSSMTEKFAANTLIYVLGGIVMVLVCLGLADLTRLAALWFFRDDTLLVPGPTAFTNSVIEYVKTLPSSDFWSCLPKFLLNSLWYVSLFMMGSILWPKNSFGKTLIVMLAYWIIMGLIELNVNDFSYSLFQDHENFMVFERCIDGVVIILCWVCGWYLFKRKNIISLKWWK